MQNRDIWIKARKYSHIIFQYNKPVYYSGKLHVFAIGNIRHWLSSECLLPFLGLSWLPPWFSPCHFSPPFPPVWLHQPCPPPSHRLHHSQNHPGKLALESWSKVERYVQSWTGWQIAKKRTLNMRLTIMTIMMAQVGEIRFSCWAELKKQIQLGTLRFLNTKFEYNELLKKSWIQNTTVLNILMSKTMRSISREKRKILTILLNHFFF